MEHAGKFHDEEYILEIIIQQMRALPIYGQNINVFVTVHNRYPAIYVACEDSTEVL